MGVRILPQHLTIMGALALALCLLLLGAAGSKKAYALEEVYRPGQVIVKLNPVIGATIDEINADYGSTTLDDTLGSMNIYLVKPPDSVTVIEFVGDLVSDSDPDERVLYAEPNFVAEAPEGDARMKARSISGTRESKEGSSDRWAAKNLRLSCAAEISRGKGITVAVLDTGAQLRHPALEANFTGVKRYDFVDNDTNPSEPRRVVGLVGHGTHVAGIVDRVAPAAKIMPLRVLNAKGTGDVFTIAKAISYAQRNGARVINLSLGSSSHSKLLQEMIKKAIAKGVVVAAAAGNSGTETAHYPAAGAAPFTPRSADGLVAVTSVDRYEKKSWFANYGLWVDIVAPGQGIRSAFPVNKYANWSGTSMATPFISGQAALIRKVHGPLGPAAIEQKMYDTARRIDSKNLAYALKLGKGHADVCKSLL